MRLLKASIAAASMSACAHAQEAAPARMAPPDVRAITPALADYTDAVLFGDVWKRPGLSPRDRSIVTVSALIAGGHTAQMTGHFNRAIDNGVKPAELTGIITHLAFYAGWPRAMSAVSVAKDVFEQRGIDTASLSGAVQTLAPLAGEDERAASVDSQLGASAPGLATYTNDVLFGDLWRRDDLLPRDRSLVTISALIAAGQGEQLPFHLNRGFDNGLTPEAVSEVVTHLAFYAGWPRAMSAVTVLKTVLDQRSSQVSAGAAPARAEPRLTVQRYVESSPAPSENFTGAMKVESRFQREAPARVGGGVVSFTPGARTNWHTHPLGQTLVVTEGCGWVQEEGGPVETIRPGDVVVIPPNARHWHGATAETPMMHVAIAERLDGVAVTWMEAVSDQQYSGGATACRS